MSNSKRPANPNASSGQSRSGMTAVVAVIVVVCLVAFVVLGVVVAGDDDSAGSSGDFSAAEVGSAGDCAEPPPVPEAPASYSEPPDPSVAEDAVWEATITTNCGVITADLFGDEAPQTVASFITLAEDGYWQDGPCHRVTTEGIFVLQCGDPTGTGGGAPGYGFEVENAPADSVYPRGTLAMARGNDPSSNGGQWFIVYDETRLPAVGGGYTIFGEVTSGLEVVDAVAEAGVAGGGSDGAPIQPISLLDVSVEEM